MPISFAKNLLSGIMLVLLLSACSKSDSGAGFATAPQTTPNSESSWGIDFQLDSIETLDNSRKEMANKVVKIQSITGQSGTGILISNDGLVLTNEHIIPREACAQERCAGFRVLRGFYPGGPNEIYTDVKVLAQSKELDIALIKINVPAWKKVPYFVIHDLDALEFETSQKYALIGHPYGTSAKYSEVMILENKQQYFDLHTIALSGSSGSPIIDLKSGKVVGLYRGGKWSKETVNKKTGNVIHVGQAINMKEIVAVLDKGFPSVFSEESTVSHLSIVLTSISRRDTKPPVANFYPMKKADLVKTYNSEIFFNLVFGTPDEFQYIKSYTKYLEALVLNSSLEINDELDKMVVLFTTLKANNLQFNQQSSSYINYWAKRWLPDLGVNVKLLLEVISPTDKCLSHIPRDLNSIENMHMRSMFCRSVFTANGESMIELIQENIEQGNFQDEQSGDYLKLLNSLATNFRNNQAMLNVLKKYALEFSQLTENLPSALRFEAFAREIELIISGTSMVWEIRRP